MKAWLAWLAWYPEEGSIIVFGSTRLCARYEAADLLMGDPADDDPAAEQSTGTTGRHV